MVCGGGSRNPLLMARLRHYCQAQKSPPPMPLALVARHGSIGFRLACLADAGGITRNLPSVTGASQETVLGAIFPATRDIRVN